MVFRGRPNYRRTVERFNVARLAMLRGEFDSLPVTTRIPVDGMAGEAYPSNVWYIIWWSPRINEKEPFIPVRMISAEGGLLRRYPHEGD